ncbi:LLM class flavin-dependent oxidoreductase [Pseudonocardia nematodicida]|uniref:LLM class flavin-dependent oxidoreductase n=1 Tax=Pseudonocardia nematodicida TaxID=1206997 RepID=A0ABV1KFZ1_9PSEU
MDIGLITFASLLPDHRSGDRPTVHDRLRGVVDDAVAAERLGFAWFAVGEHHFRHYDTVPAPSLVLAAIAERTSTIRVATATTLVTNRDPVLLAEDYALLDQLSGGRLELIAGTSFFPEVYAVFDQDPATRVARKRENVELLLRLWREESVTWSGRFRPPLTEVTARPRPHQERPPVWVSGGASEDSIRLAVENGLPMVFGTVARTPGEWTRWFELYRTLWREHGHAGPPPRLGGASHAFVAPTTQEARRQWQGHVEAYYRLAGAEGPLDLDEQAGPDGPLLCGSPAQVVDKLGRLGELWGHGLHLLAVDIGGIPAAEVSASVELIAAEVLPQLGARPAPAAGVNGAVVGVS